MGLGTLAVALALVVALGAVALLAFTYWRAVLLLRPVRRALRFAPESLGLPLEQVRFPGPRGTLAGWYLPATNGCTLLYCHGIHDNASQWMLPAARLYERSGYGALLLDFAGHGESEGGQVTYGAREQDDVAAALTYLRNRHDVDMTRVGIIGCSLGAITALLAAARFPELRAVVSESGFADVQRDLSKLFTRYTGLPSFPFADLIVFWGERLSGVKLAEIRPVRVIGRISPRAVLLIGDLRDELADEPYDSEHLFAAAGEPKALWHVPEAGHVNAFAAAPHEWVQRVGDFLDAHLAAPLPQPAQTRSEDA